MKGGQLFLPAGSPLSENNSCSGSAKDQDRSLPIANVSRIMKRSLPANAKISKEAKETVQECASEFISFITGEAFDKCQREKRKTVSGDDLLWAMTTLGFDSYVAPLKAYLSRYMESEGEKNAVAVQPSEADSVSGKYYPHSINYEEKSYGGGFITAAPSFRSGHGLFGGMVVGVCEEGGGQGGGRGPLQGKLGYGGCFL